MKSLLLLAVALLLTGVLWAQKNNSAPVYSTKAGAIHGYDPVAYFTQQQPVKGLPNISYQWKDATWHFATEANRDAFIQTPEKYAPQYGGWCAYGWAQGYPAKTEPDAWSVVDGKLYLNYDRSVQKKWEAKREKYIQDANKNYSGQ